MLLFYLKCREKKQRVKTQKLQRQIKESWRFYQNVQRLIVKRKKKKKKKFIEISQKKPKKLVIC